jgi:multiple sugar transport system substrate-binding protein
VARKRYSKTTRIHRRQFLKSTIATSLAAGLPTAVVPLNATAGKKTLRVMRWKNFVPKFEDWFNEVFVKEWGLANDTEVIIDNVGLGEINSLAAAEVEAQHGHDLVLFLESRAILEDHVIDHREIFEECKNLYGDPLEFTVRSCFNPKTNKYHGFCESYAPTVLTYRKDLWGELGYSPQSWDEILKGGRAIKLLREKPIGISLAPEHNSEHSMRSLMSAFGSYVQDEDSNLALRSNNTLNALEFVKSLFEEAMTPDVLSWNPANKEPCEQQSVHVIG